MSLTPYADSRAMVWHGSCLDIMAAMPEGSVDAIVTDPPYGLGFMGKKWDDLPPGREWAEACLRVLKPGGHLLAFGGTRTWHRLAVAVEDAGFEMRDSIAWLYGSGFPKSLDVSKAIDKVGRGAMVRAKLLHFATERGVNGAWLEAHGVASGSSFADWTVGGHVPSDRNWQLVKTALDVTPDEEAAFERAVITKRRGADRRSDGTVVGLGHTGNADVTAPATDDARTWQGWGTALKPAFEPIVVARKPLVGTVAANVLTHGTGALNTDGCRIGSEGGRRDTGVDSRSPESVSAYGHGLNGRSSELVPGLGRWPANVILDESQATELDQQSGTSKSTKGKPRSAGSGEGWRLTATGTEHEDSGGASRFFYVAKAPKRERPVVDGVAHPTVKPLALMRWCVRLVTPPDGLVLDTFAGSGTTGEACLLEGFRTLLAEREADYLPLIAARLTRNLNGDTAA